MPRKSLSDVEVLARVTWIMASTVAFVDGEWGQKELEAFADVLTKMHDSSKSKIVRDVAKFHAEDDRAQAVVEKGLKGWREDLALCGTALEKFPVSDAMRFIYWTKELGLQIALAQNSGGWFGGSKSLSDNQKKVVSNVQLPLLRGKVLKKLVEGPDINPFLNLNAWIEENGG